MTIEERALDLIFLDEPPRGEYFEAYCEENSGVLWSDEAYNVEYMYENLTCAEIYAQYCVLVGIQKEAQQAQFEELKELLKNVH